MLRSTPTSDPASATDALLTIIRPVAEPQSLDGISTVWQEKSDDPSHAVDQLFASLDESELVSEVGLFSSLV